MLHGSCRTAAPSDYAGLATSSYYFNSYGNKKVGHLTISALFDPSSCPSRKTSLKPKKICQTGEKNVVARPQLLTTKRRPSWRKVFVRSKKMKSILLLHVITIVYASNFSVVKEVEAVLDPAAFSAVRFTISAIPFLPVVFQARNDVQTRNAGMELGLWVSLGYLIEALGLLTSDAGRASVLSLFTVITVPFLESMLGAIVPAQTWFGIMMSVVGVAMLECSGSPPNIGDLLNFLSAIFFGVHTLRTEHISKHMKKKDFLPILGYEVCVVALLSVIWYLIGVCFDGIQGSGELSWTWTEFCDCMIAFPWIPALYTGVISTGLCLWGELEAMRNVSATETAIIYGLEPLWGAGFAWFLLGERWGTAAWIGAALVLCGSLTVQILGSSHCESRETGEDGTKDDHLMVSNNQSLQTGLSPSRVTIQTMKDIKTLK